MTDLAMSPLPVTSIVSVASFAPGGHTDEALTALHLACMAALPHSVLIVPAGQYRHRDRCRVEVAVL